MTHRQLPFSGRRLVTNLLVGAAVLVASIGSQPAAAATQTTGGVDAYETPATVGADGGAADRSHSSGGASSIGVISQPKNVTTSTPGLQASFAAMNHFDERFGSASGPNQFSLEPPDQGLCVGRDGAGNVRVVEALNDVFQVYDTSGNKLLAKPTALNAFLGYAPSIIRSPLTFGPFVTDPSCLYDSATGRWFLDALTLETFPKIGEDGLQHFTGVNHIDVAVSNSSDPTGSWTIYHTAVQDDGTQGTPNHGCSAGTSTAKPLPTNPNACLGDYPHIGSNADGIYITTNEYSFFGNEFHGAQVYAYSKSGLVAGSNSTPVQINTQGRDTFGFALNGFTLWPSVTPTANGYGAGDSTSGGTEWFLSSNAAAEAHDTGDGKSTFHDSSQLLVWALTNTSSLSGSPALSLSNAKLDVGEYTFPPASTQKDGNEPQRTCNNNNSCSLALNGIKDPFAEQPSPIDSNDTRMQQVTWLNGSLWGALDTGLNVSSSMQAGIEWFKVASSSASGSAAGSLSGNGYVGLGQDNLTYPAIGITTSGTGVMAFTVVGNNFYPSAGYATIDGNGVSDVHIAAAGLGPDDGFTDYRINANPPDFIARPRWGDYGAAVPWGNGVWLASEYIGQTCDFSTYERTNFRCFNSRTALANWYTRISLVSAP